MRGFRDGTRTYGVLLDYIEVAVIGGFIYTAPRPVGAPKGSKGPPPRVLFTLIQKLHPEVRRRIRRSQEVFEQRYWRTDVALWDREVKPALIAEARALMAEDVNAYRPTDLAAHVRRATDFLSRCTYWHHRFNICAMLPVGDFLVQTMAWTGMSPAELLGAMRGESKVSAGAVDELVAARQAIMADPAALATLQSPAAPRDLIESLRQHPGEVGRAVSAYIDVVGLRVLGGYDVADRHAGEHPEMLVKILRTAVAAIEASGRDAARQSIASVRSRVPAEHQAAFDALLEEAQFTYRIRDERVFHGDAMGVGLARRAILAAGKLLAAQGRIEDPEHLIDATPDEIVAMLEAAGPSSAELASRARWRRETPISAAPANLGFPPSEPPPAEWLPPAAARTQRVITLVLSLLFDVHKRPEAPQAKTLKGFAVSPGVYEGPARVIRSVEELPLVQSGEVLIASSTGPTFNVVLPLIGALVTERGGVLSHAAIVSREYGLPGIVGCVGATAAVTTGTRVRVDGNTGELWALE
jgi:rifampicin phosphotransferase